ncbi:hypothetical protein AU512_05770 [Lonsdalea iberica]|uniref:Type III secretion protein n=1 Tax=Lonsdalea iberica TaxID=1082703 RepID=A0ABX3XH28_9GAMM|nr:hypothetical protein [Lonsdalea iberica]OSN10898.1 hypothetical protein AU512_05770 [Lonsdalea iberica]
MRSRRTAEAAALFDQRLTLNRLLQIKHRREQRQRRQMAEVTRRITQTEAMCEQCQQRRSQVVQQLGQILNWSGTLSAWELMEQKQKMGRLFHEEIVLARQQRLLSDQKTELQNQRDELHCELSVTLKKVEKLRSLLNDEQD